MIWVLSHIYAEECNMTGNIRFMILVMELKKKHPSCPGVFFEKKGENDDSYSWSYYASLRLIQT